MTERGLVEAAMRGDAGAFSTLVAQYQRAMIASARHVTRNDADAEDVAQEALIDAYRSLPALRDRGKFRPWLFGILRHKCLDYLQARRPEELAFDEMAEAIPAPIPAELPDLADLLDQLPFIYREVLVMHYMQELEFRDMARLLDITEMAVRKRFSRARTQLRALATERDDRRLRKAMAGLLALPLNNAFTYRVTKEVLTMAQVTAKTKAAASGTATGLAWLLGWKGLVTAGIILVVGAGIAVPVAINHRRHAVLPAAGASTVPVHFVSLQPTPAAQQEAKVLQQTMQAYWQPTPNFHALAKVMELPKIPNSKLTQQAQQMIMEQTMNVMEHNPELLKMWQKGYERRGAIQDIQITGIQQVTDNGETCERLLFKVVYAKVTLDGNSIDINDKQQVTMFAPNKN